jgi:hypothetical protein
MSLLYKLADLAFTAWAIAVVVGWMEVPSAKTVAVLAIWVMSEAMSLAAWKHEVKEGWGMTDGVRIPD